MQVAAEVVAVFAHTGRKSQLLMTSKRVLITGLTRWLAPDINPVTPHRSARLGDITSQQRCRVSEICVKKERKKKKAPCESINQPVN